MTRYLLLLALVVPASAGCLKKHAQTDANRPPTPRGTGELTKAPPKAVPTPPARDLSVAKAAEAAPLLDPPQLTLGTEVVATAAAEVQPPPGKEKRIERREERKEERKEKKDPPTPEKPKLPSPFVSNPATPDPASKPSTAADAETNSDLAAIRKRYALTQAQWEKLVDFEARLVKREVVNGKESPTEEVLYRYRKSPMSIYMKNIGDHGKGREVLFVNKPGAKVHIVTGQGDQVLLRPGMYLQLDPDSPLIAGKSRQKIAEAGFAKGIEQVGQLLALAEKGQFDGLKALGEVKRKEYPYPLEGMEIRLKPGDDPTLPKGGKREVYVDPKPDSPSYGLPVVVRAFDHAGKEVEYYAFDQFKLPAHLTDAEFSPDRLNKRK